MSTHANISFYDDKTNMVKTIYLHSDGYKEYAGRMLLEHYTTEEKVRELIKLGDLSSIAASTGTTEGHSFTCPVNGYCIAYGRDRGEKNVSASIQHYHDYKKHLDEEFNYLFADGRWCQISKNDIEYLVLTQEEKTEMHDSYFQVPCEEYSYA